METTPLLELPTAGRQRLQFSLRGLLLLTFGVAVGLSAATLKNASWPDGLLAAAAAWMVLGLLNQAFDLWQTFHGQADLPDDVRWGWRFAFLWRLCIACLLTACYLTNALLHLEAVQLPEVDDTVLYATGPNLRRALFYLLLIVVAWSVPSRTRQRVPSLWSPLIDVLAGVAAVAWCLLLWSGMGMIHFFVHVAAQEIDNVASSRFAEEGLNVYSNAHWQRFFWYALVAAICVLLAVGITRQLARQWREGMWRRWRWAILLLPTVTVPTAFVIWLETYGLRATSPRFAEVQSLGPLHRWYVGIALLIVFVTAATYRFTEVPQAPCEEGEWLWRKQPERYYHERPAVLLFLICTAMVHPALALTQLSEYAWYAFADLFFDLLLALALISLSRTFSMWFRPIDLASLGPPRLALGQFCAVWLALFATAVVGIPTLAALCFAIWLPPLYGWPWP
jgi:hypothetical protein